MSDPTADLLDRHGIPSQATSVVLAAIDLDLSIAHQVRGLDVDHGHVARLQEGYERGDVFPPLIVRYVDGRLALVGGMHRTHAALAADVALHRAYLVDVDDHTARLLAVDDNARHGLPLTKPEARRQGALLVEEGSTQADAAKAVGVSQQAISDEVAVRKGDRLAAEHGVELAWRQIARNSNGAAPKQYALTLTKIDDPACFAAAVEVLAENPAARKPDVVQDLVRRLAKIGDQQDRLAEIGDLEDQGDGYSGGPGGYDVHARDDTPSVVLTRLLIDLTDLDPVAAVAGLKGRDALDRTDKRLTEAGKRLIQLGAEIKRRRRAA